MFAALCCGVIVIAAEPPTIPPLRRAAAIEVPGRCSSHAIPIPRGGAPIALRLLVATALIRSTASASFLLAIAGFSAIGLAEDLRGLSVRCCLGLQGVAPALRQGADGISWGRRRPRSRKSWGTATQPHRIIVAEDHGLHSRLPSCASAGRSSSQPVRSRRGPGRRLQILDHYFCFRRPGRRADALGQAEPVEHIWSRDDLV